MVTPPSGQRVIGKRTLLLLVAGALFAPIAIVLVLAVATLLGAMQDEAGQYALKRVALGLGMLWALDLVGLVVVLAVNALADEPGEEKNEP
jgi:hypothetical protein